MKLSFSTNGWLGYTWEGFIRMASDYGFKGIELHGGGAETFTQPGGPLDPLHSQTTQRQLREAGLCSRVTSWATLRPFPAGGELHRVRGRRLRAPRASAPPA